MKNRNWTLVPFLFTLVLGISQLCSTEVHASSSYFTSQGCVDCHAAPAVATCNGCHAHGTHSTSGKSDINVAGTTNKTSYAPGETVSVTITGGYRTGWVRAILYNQNNVEVARSSGNDSGMGSSTTFPAVLTAPAPTTPGTYTWKAGWYGNQYDASGAKFGAGWTPDATNSGHGYELVSTNSFTVVAPADTTAPVVGTFTLPATATSLTVPVTALTASDNVAVTGYLITTSTTAPAASAAGWSAGAPTTITVSAAGSYTFYAWAKDGAGNVSATKSATVTVTLPDTTAPVIGSFTLPATATSLTVPVTALTASDNVAVTGYLITTSATAPAASAAGWTASAPTTITVSAAGSYTFYAWAKDGAGNVSATKSATVTVTLPDTTAPVIGTFTLPATVTNLTVPVTTLTASDNIAVTGYLITTSATAPAASATGWTASAPATVTVSAAGSYTFYAWAKDGAGNVSAAKSATVTVTLPDTTAPVIGTFTLPATATSLTVPVSALTASDNVAVTGYLITTSATTPAASATGWSATAPTSVTVSAAGSYTFYAWAKDGAGNVSLSRSATVSVTTAPAADTTKPTLTISALADGSFTNKTTLNISGSATDSGGLQTVSVNGQVIVVNADGSFTYALPLVSGANAVTVVATDKAGNQQVDSRTITFDPMAPVLTVSSPADNSSSAQSFITLTGTVNESSTVSVSNNGGTPQAASISGRNFTATVNLVPGVNTIVITATDLAGNVSSAKRTITYDGATITMAVTYP
ncbi:MAG TPA: hypothetical protein VFF53_12445, partial [Geobacteraceae bacterium]|nr:hypothetical protein [Geobacteraceae bacterium]